MRALNDLAIYIVAAWKVANPEKRMPTSGGALDAAMEKVVEQLPAEFKNLLTFGDTRIGRRCYELDSVMAFARDSELISDPNPKYITSEVAINDASAKRLLRTLGADVEAAKKFAQSLRGAVEAAASGRSGSGALHDAA